LWHPTVFGDQTMTVAVVDRLIHHATIFEMNVESYRRRAALGRNFDTSDAAFGTDAQNLGVDH
jgi:hypothetical protein